MTGKKKKKKDLRENRKIVESKGPDTTFGGPDATTEDMRMTHLPVCVLGSITR